jgi:integrase
MRVNKYGIRGLKGVQLKRGFVYFWVPPVSLQKDGTFHYATLGTDFPTAVAMAQEWNAKLDVHRGVSIRTKVALGVIKPMTVAYLFRNFEISPRFSRYALRTRQDYSCFYRHAETTLTDNGIVFGDFNVSTVTKPVAYSIYEQYVVAHGNDSANKAVSACRAAFNYGMLKLGQIPANPFLQLDKLTPPPRRQRWTDGQLIDFIKTAREMGYPSVGLCALLCMELVQRPGDILNMRWGAYEERNGTWYIRQTKRGAVVRVPETQRLRTALLSAKQVALEKLSALEGHG